MELYLAQLHENAQQCCAYEGEKSKERLGSVDSTGKCGDGTHLNEYREHIEHRSTGKAQQTTGLPLPPCPAFLFPNSTSPVMPSRD